MEGFNYQINESVEGDAMDHLDFTSGDVDQVLFDSQDSLLNSIEPIGECQDATFLNPINDILNDINDFSKNFCDQSAAFQSMPPSAPPPNSNQMPNAWALQETAESVSASSYVNLSDAPKAAGETSSNMGGGFFNISAESDQSALMPDTAVEFPASDCPFLGGEYSSTINQWFQSLEQQQMPFMATSLSAMPLTSSLPQAMHTVQGYSDTFLSTIGTLPASTTITPITVEDHQFNHRPQSPVQQEVTIEARLLPERSGSFSTSRGALFLPAGVDTSNVLNPICQQDMYKRLNVDQTMWKPEGVYVPQAGYTLPHSSTPMSKTCTSVGHNAMPPFMNPQIFTKKPSGMPPRRMPAIGFQKNRLHWTAVFPRKHFIQPPEMIIMHPLRTRKLMAARRSVPSSCSSNYGATINLSEYFDTSSIDIPMIRERARPANRSENRRKQKLNNIPGSENLVFEVQKNDATDSEDLMQSAHCGKEQVHNEIDPYPETELPELDEIFRRKKKTPSMITTGSKRVCPVSQPLGTIPPQKKHCQNPAVLQAVVQESSASFEEKVSVSIAVRKSRSNLSIDKSDLAFSSESDFIESDDENDSSVLAGRSLKCQKCKKIFKTIRSLSIHTKRCAVVPCEKSPGMRSVQDCVITNSNNENEEKLYSAGFKNIPKSNRVLQDNSLDFDLSTSANIADEFNVKPIGTCGENKARPITRSQTRRTTTRSATGSITLKRSK